jgi:hypothetical protein
LANSNTSANSSPRSSTTLGNQDSARITTLLPGQSSEFIINHEIKELGIHILVCSVHYTPSKQQGASQAERKFFRKFYKFQVLNPLAVKTKVNTLSDAGITLETQIQNLCAVPIYLSKMKFDQNPLFDFTDLNINIDHGNITDLNIDKNHGNINDLNIDKNHGNINDLNNKGENVFGESRMVGPNDTRQYLYLLTPKIPSDLETRTTPNLGKLDIGWNSSMGQSGKLQTSQLTRRVPQVSQFEIIVISISHIHVETPFTIRLRIRNNLEEKLKLIIQGIKSKMSHILIYGPNEINIGEIEGRCNVDFEMKFFALIPGTHKITGINIVESFSGVSKEVDCLAVVHVQ